MPDGVARAQHWPLGAVRAGRAAAFLSLATGINGMLASYVPAWDARWLYIATVGLIAALDGWIIGIIAAIGAVVCYELMSFGAFGFVQDRDAFLLAAAVVVAIVARTLRVSISPPAPRDSTTRPLLTGIVSDAAGAPLQNESREALAALRTQLDHERARAERDRALRLDQEKQYRAELETLSAEFRQARQTADQMTRHNVGLQNAAAAAELALRGNAQEISALQKMIEQLRTSAAEIETQRSHAAARASELEQTLLDLRSALQREQALSSDSRQRLADLENINDQLTTAIAELTSARDMALARTHEQEDHARQLMDRIADLEVLRDDAGARAVDLQWSLDQMQQKLLAAEASGQGTGAAAAELQHENEQLRATVAALQSTQQDTSATLHEVEAANHRLRAEIDQQRYRLDSEWNEKLARNAVELTDRFNATMLAADARTDAARADAAALRERVDELQREHAALRDAFEERAQAAAAAELRAGHLEVENGEIRTAAGELRARLEAQWQETIESHQAESERLRASLSVAEQRAQSSSAELEAAAARLAEVERLNLELRAGNEHVDEQQADVAALRATIDELQSQLARASESHESALRHAEEEWSEKFARSAMEITQRFQAEIAAARQETASLRDISERAADRIRELEDDNSELRAEAAAEKVKLDSEWNEKLETIVHHLASDHEADIGQATLEKEEARAEARRLGKRVAQLEASGREIASAFEEMQRRNEALRAELEQQRSLARAEKERADGRDGEWSARLAANALELTQRFNGTMAAADNRLQDLRRESQALQSRVSELEQINAALRASDQERREAIDREWGEKLETIVSHLASDHENDIGQAMMEREESRAEARMLNSRLAALQKSVAAERKAFDDAKLAWAADREQLTRTLESLRRRLGLGTASGAAPLPAAVSDHHAVLVVHRDSAVRAIAKHALESAGYDVITAADGLEAFRVATSLRPDVILAETTMPKMDGRELIQMLKSRPETAGVKIVLMAGSAAEAGSYASSDFRADDFLRDPANVEALKTTLANVLAARV